MVGLAHRIADFVGDRPTHLRELYHAFPAKPKTTIRGRIYENLGRLFERLDRGVYIATVGDAKCIVIKGDAWEELKNLKDQSFDALLTDHAYPWLNKHFNVWSTKHSRKSGLSYPTRELDDEIIREFHRVLKPRAHAMFFVPSISSDTKQHLDAFIERLKRNEFKFNKLLIWDKVKIGMGYRGRSRYEGIAFFSKGKCRRPCDSSIPDLISVKRIPTAKRRHESEKPVELIEQLVRFSTNEGEWVIDPFAGSGNVGKACLNLNRNAVLIEIDGRFVRDVIVPNLGAECLEMASDGKI